MADSLKILIVEDEPDLVGSLKSNLETHGYGVLTTADGITALEMARKEIPNIILLDLMLPGLDGYHFLKLLKSDERYRQIPILVITARADAQDLTLAMECGANECLGKPLEFNVLISRIRSLLSEGVHLKVSPKETF